jgi:DNA end-binding protein Ku
MSRAIWTGTLSFGLVAIPVGLHSATKEHELEFHQFEEGTSDRIRYKRVNERTGEEVPFERIVKGVDVGGGDLVLVSRDELEQVAPGRSRLLSIVKFVDVAEVDPVFYARTYYLGPVGEGAATPYRLLLAALARTGRAAVASFVMREKEYLALIRPAGDVLALSTLYFADEVRDPRRELGDLPEAEPVGGKELAIAAQLIDALSGPWDPAEFHDSYTDGVRDLVESKRTGGQLVAAAEPPQPTKVVDLMEVLRRSVQAASTSRPAPTSSAASGDGDGDDLSGRTKSDLDKLARQLHIKGRSTMTKAHLIRAIRDARQHHETRRAS